MIIVFLVCDVKKSLLRSTYRLHFYNKDMEIAIHCQDRQNIRHRQVRNAFCSPSAVVWALVGQSHRRIRSFRYRKGRLEGCKLIKTFF